MVTLGWRDSETGEKYVVAVGVRDDEMGGYYAVKVDPETHESLGGNVFFAFDADLF